MNESERDLVDATAKLAETLKLLRAELRQPSDKSHTLRRPPRPVEFLRFTERYTIPTVIALLEASIKALELLAAALRIADGRSLEAVTKRSNRESGTDSLDTVGRVGRDRLARTSRETLQRLDDALADVQSAVSAEPSNPEIERLLEDARELRSDVDERLAAAIEDRDVTDTLEAKEQNSVEIGIRAISDDPDEAGESQDDRVGIDVDEELASIKDEIDTERSSGRTSDKPNSDVEDGDRDSTKPDGEERPS